MQTHSITKSTLIVFILTALSTIAGFASQIITAHYFGASKELDAFITASALPSLLYGLSNASVMTALIYTFIRNKIENNTAEFNATASNILNITVIVLACTALIIFLSSHMIAKIIAPGFDAEQLKTTSNNLKILSLTVVFTGLTSILTGLLYLKNKFATPNSLKFLIATATIVSTILFYKKYGIYSLAIGLTAGTITTAILQFINLLNTNFKYQLKIIITDKTIKHLFYNALPLILIAITYYLNRTINNIIASTLENGSISILNYAFTIASAIPILISTPISTTTFPQLTKRNNDKNTQQFIQLFTKTIKLTLFTLLPITIILIALKTEIITIFLQRGKFDLFTTAKTASALGYYLVGLPAIGLYPLILNSLISTGELKKSVKLSLALPITNTTLSILLLSHTTNGIALATAITYWIACTIGFWQIKMKIKEFNPKEIIKNLLKIIISILPGTIVLITVQSKITNNYLLIILTAVIYILLYILFCKLLKIKELETIINKIYNYCTFK